MRALGFTLLAISVLLGTGGVAVQSAADAGGATAAAPAGSAPADPAQCPVSGASEARTPVRTTPVQAVAPGERQVIILNTRGYNYRRPGDSPVTPVEVIPPAAPVADPASSPSGEPAE